MNAADSESGELKNNNSKFVVYGVSSHHPNYVDGSESVRDPHHFTGSRPGRTGIGIDVQLNDSLNAGVEISWREIRQPTANFSAPATLEIGNPNERLHRAYLSWTPSPNWTLGLGVSYERLERASEENPRCFFGNCTTYNSATPVDTMQVPLVARSSSPSGVFAGISTTFVRKEAESSPLSFVLSFFNNPSDNIVLLDAGLGYRLPRRQGVLSLEVLSTLDKGSPNENKETRFEKRPIFSAPHDRAIAIRLSLDF